VAMIILPGERDAWHENPHHNDAPNQVEERHRVIVTDRRVRLGGAVQRRVRGEPRRARSKANAREAIERAQLQSTVRACGPHPATTTSLLCARNRCACPLCDRTNDTLAIVL
jgi:hypothetical protein